MRKQGISLCFGAAILLLFLLTGCGEEGGKNTETALVLVRIEEIRNPQLMCQASPPASAARQRAPGIPVDVEEIILRITQDGVDITQDLCMSENPCKIPLQSGSRFFRIKAGLPYRFEVTLLNRKRDNQQQDVIFQGEELATLSRGEVKSIDIAPRPINVEKIVKEEPIQSIRGGECRRPAEK